tara:strand:+ start:241 stop:426 length:186 start_codon:yes stop_codon:yes gene_type:complete
MNPAVVGKNGAGNETRTRDFHLGKVVLYQLSYSRFIGLDTEPRILAHATGVSIVIDLRPQL